MTAKVDGSNPHSTPGSQQRNSGLQSKDFFEVFTILPKNRFRTTDSGLRIASLKEGEGTSAAKGMKLKVKYTGWLGHGKKFDSSLKRNQPFEFTLGAGQVIKGWEEGLVGAQPGERRQLIIPPALGYGNKNSGSIPPGSTLIFNVEVVSVEKMGGNSKGNISMVA